VWTVKAGATLDHLDPAFFCHAGQTTGQSADHLILEATQFVEVDEWLTKTDSVLLQRGRFFDDSAGVQQCFGGYTAHIEANATQHRIPFDQCYPQTQVGRTEGGRVSARPGPQHDKIIFTARVFGSLVFV
jgi:hypothetical protein